MHIQILLYSWVLWICSGLSRASGFDECSNWLFELLGLAGALRLATRVCSAWLARSNWPFEPVGQLRLAGALEFAARVRLRLSRLRCVGRSNCPLQTAGPRLGSRIDRSSPLGLTGALELGQVRWGTRIGYLNTAARQRPPIDIHGVLISTCFGLLMSTSQLHESLHLNN